MWNKIKSKYPTFYKEVQQPDGSLAVTKLEALLKYLEATSNNSQTLPKIELD
jgi:hypothetical protein